MPLTTYPTAEVREIVALGFLGQLFCELYLYLIMVL